MGRRRMTGPERAAQLLDVAERLFIEQGYEQTSLEDVARAAGVSRPIVYQHHGSKERLYLAAVARARGALQEDTLAALGTVSEPRDALRAAAQVWFDEVERNPRRWQLLHTDRIVRLSPELAADIELPTTGPFYAAALAGWVRPDISDTRVMASAQMVIGAALELAHWWIDNDEMSRDEVVAELVDFCWSGLSAMLPAA